MSSGAGISVLFDNDSVSDSNSYHKSDLDFRSVDSFFIPY
jgi:hypothetical protein